MKPILVPAPPRSAYNENRRVSDLLFSQLKHFQHLERKRGDLEISPVLAGDIYTEGGAARYIAAVTRALRGTASLPLADAAAVSSAKPTLEPPKAVPAVPLPPARVTILAGGKKSASRKTARKRTAKKTPEKK